MNGPSPESAPASLSVDASQDRGACLTRWLLGAPNTGRSASRQAMRVQRQALHKTNMMVLVFWVWLRYPSSPGLYQAVFSTPGNDTLQAWARDQNTTATAINKSPLLPTISRWSGCSRCTRRRPSYSARAIADHEPFLAMIAPTSLPVQGPTFFVSKAGLEVATILCSPPGPDTLLDTYKCSDNLGFP